MSTNADREAAAIADIIGQMVSGPMLARDPEFAKAHRQDQLAAAHAILRHRETSTCGDVSQVGTLTPEPCAHCGGEAETYKSSDKVHPYRTVCKGCGASTAYHGDWARCVAFWNRRFTPSTTEAVRKAWQRVSDELDNIEGGMHAGLEDAASDMWTTVDAKELGAKDALAALSTPSEVSNPVADNIGGEGKRARYDEAIPEIAEAARKFKPGDRVEHTRHGWVGTVSGEQLDSGVTYVEFDTIGKFGADPRLLAPTGDAVREALRNRLVEAADNAGAFDEHEAVVSIDDAIAAALSALNHGGSQQ